MSSTQFNGTPVPAGSNQVAVPADLKKLADSVDQRLNLLALNENDRNVRYSDVQAGTLVSTPDGWQWLKITSPPDAPEWITVRSVEETTGFSWNDTRWADGGNSWLKRSGTRYEMQVLAAYTADDPIPSGNIPNETILDLPSGWEVDHRVPITGIIQSSYGCAGYVSSALLITDIPDYTSGIATGTTVNFYAVWGV